MSWYSNTSSTFYENYEKFYEKSNNPCYHTIKDLPKEDFERQLNGDFERQLNGEEKPKEEKVLLFDPENLVL